MATNISWTNETWNPIVGCSKISAGCQKCYAAEAAKSARLQQFTQYKDVKNWDGTTVFVDSNGRSGVLPDMRDSDRALMERYDPNTVDDRPFASTVARSTAIAQDRFEIAKQNCLADYITAISGNLSDFSDEQIAFLAKIINEESANRIGF